jgi:phospholipid/cholesterol/gamma-HCH transport system substrate-binding protein
VSLRSMNCLPLQKFPRAAGLYATANVTYRGTEVGRVTDVHLTDSGVAADLSLRSDVPIHSDLDAQVHSVTSLGEQYVALTPRNGDSAALKNGDVIPVDRTLVPPDINGLVETTNRGLQAIPGDSLKTAVDESYTAVGGLGPELARFVRGSTALAVDARANLDSITSLIDTSQPVLDSQVSTADAIQAWAAHLATITAELKDHDPAVTGIVQNGGQAATETRQLFERLQPSLPILMANLVTVADVALAYQPNMEQLLVLVPKSCRSSKGASSRISTPSRITRVRFSTSTSM